MNNHSAYGIIEAHASDIEVRLYTPAHQGLAGHSNYFPDQIYEYDFPFLTRSRLAGVEKYFSYLYKTKHTFLLTGGATQGVLATFGLLGTKYKQVAIGQNCHVSVINGLILSGLTPFFIPSQGLMPTAEEVIQALETDGKEVKALLLTHPSYEGFTTDVSAISRYCREREILFIVDEAHGSHFPFFEKEISSALVQGADLVIHSLHKYVGSLVQTALIHIPEDSILTEEQILDGLALFENTTRSNILILSIEEAIKRALTDEGKLLFLKAAQNCQKLRHLLDRFGTTLRHDARVRDPLKLFLYSDRATGAEIADLLVKGGVDYEYFDETGVLLIFSFHNNENEFSFVAKTLTEIYNFIHQNAETKIVRDEHYFCRIPQMRTKPREAFFSKREKITLGEAKGKISCGCIRKLPPGIPLLIPGEKITDWHLERISLDTPIEVVEE